MNFFEEKSVSQSFSSGFVSKYNPQINEGQKKSFSKEWTDRLVGVLKSTEVFETSWKTYQQSYFAVSYPKISFSNEESKFIENSELTACVRSRNASAFHAVREEVKSLLEATKDEIEALKEPFRVEGWETEWLAQAAVVKGSLEQFLPLLEKTAEHVSLLQGGNDLDQLGPNFQAEEVKSCADKIKKKLKWLSTGISQTEQELGGKKEVLKKVENKKKDELDWDFWPGGLMEEKKIVVVTTTKSSQEG